MGLFGLALSAVTKKDANIDFLDPMELFPVLGGAQKYGAEYCRTIIILRVVDG